MTESNCLIAFHMLKYSQNQLKKAVTAEELRNANAAAMYWHMRQLTAHALECKFVNQGDHNG